jgi:hypothetical protein
MKRGWTCMCGWKSIDGIEHVAEVQAHYDNCAPYQDHLKNCFCRGQGGNTPHEMKPQTPGHICAIYNCIPCELWHVPVEIPSRPRAAALRFWFDWIVNPKIERSKAERNCPHQNVNLHIPLGEVGRKMAKHVGGEPV